MAAPYQIWIRGVTGTHFDSSDGKVPTNATDNAPTQIAEPSVPNGWVLVDNYALDPTFINGNESEPTIDGKLVKGGDGRWSFKFDAYYNFPNDWSAYKSLMYHLSRHEVYLSIETYDVALHLGTECLAVDSVVAVEHNHKNGWKQVSVNLKLRDVGEVI